MFVGLEVQRFGGFSVAWRDVSGSASLKQANVRRGFLKYCRFFLALGFVGGLWGLRTRCTPGREGGCVETFSFNFFRGKGWVVCPEQRHNTLQAE